MIKAIILLVLLVLSCNSSPGATEQPPEPIATPFVAGDAVDCFPDRLPAPRADRDDVSSLNGEAVFTVDGLEDGECGWVTSGAWSKGWGNVFPGIAVYPHPFLDSILVTRTADGMQVQDDVRPICPDCFALIDNDDPRLVMPEIHDIVVDFQGTGGLCAGDAVTITLRMSAEDGLQMMDGAGTP